MGQEWKKLTRLTQGRPMLVERVRLADSEPDTEGVAIEGSFELPRLATLPEEDQLFVAAFVRSHGSIKAMERLFGVSYPTIKNRLNRIGAQFDFIEVEAGIASQSAEGPAEDPAAGHSLDPTAVLDRIAAGEISVNEALSILGED
jgi:hypothetical protein